MSESDVDGRQNLTPKVDPRADIVVTNNSKLFIMYIGP